MSTISSFVKRYRNLTRNDMSISGDAQKLEQLVWMLFLKVYDDKEKEWEIIEDDYRSIIPVECKWDNWADTTKEKGLKGDDLLNFVNNTLFPTLKNLEIPANCQRKQSIIKEVFLDIHNYMKDGIIFRDVLSLINEFNFADPKILNSFGAIYESILKELQSAGSSGEFYTPRALTDFISSHMNLKIGDTIADFACGTGGFLTSAKHYLEQKNKLTTKDKEKLKGSFYGVEKKPLPYLLCTTNLLFNGMDNINVSHDNSLMYKVSDYGDSDAFDVILMNPPYGGNEKEHILKNFPKKQRSSETADLFMILIMNRLRKKTGRAAVIIPDSFLFGVGNKAEIKKELLNNFNLHTIVRLPAGVFAPYTSITTNIVFFDSDKSTQDIWIYRVDLPDGLRAFSKTNPFTDNHLNDLNDWWNNREEIEKDGNFIAKRYSKKDIESNHYNLDLCGYSDKNKVEEDLSLTEILNELTNISNKQKDIIDNVLSEIKSLVEDK